METISRYGPVEREGLSIFVHGMRMEMASSYAYRAIMGAQPWPHQVRSTGRCPYSALQEGTADCLRSSLRSHTACVRRISVPRRIILVEVLLASCCQAVRRGVGKSSHWQHDEDSVIPRVTAMISDVQSMATGRTGSRTTLRPEMKT